MGRKLIMRNNQIIASIADEVSALPSLQFHPADKSTPSVKRMVNLRNHIDYWFRVMRLKNAYLDYILKTGASTSNNVFLFSQIVATQKEFSEAYAKVSGMIKEYRSALEFYANR